jgi:DNA modification methylase
VNPLVSDPDFTLHVGDVRDVLRELEPESVHCVVTSPPYWGLRDYSVEGQLGLEPTPEEYVANMVEVFREVRRVLRKDGTCWVNLGDSYMSNPGDPEKRGQEWSGMGYQSWYPRRVPGLKQKDLVGMPWRIAFALQADGWYLRSDIIWAKPNPMPESVTDRPTKAHEYVFLLTKSPRYFYDAEAVREPHHWGPNSHSNGTAGYRGGFTRAERQEGDQGRPPFAIAPGGVTYNPAGRNRRSVWEIEQETLDPSLPPEKPRGPDGRRKTTVQGREGSIQHRDGERWPEGGANVRSVWHIATEPYPEAHFATFPQALVEPCIKAGTSERGCCPECGAPWVREVEHHAGVAEAHERPKKTKGMDSSTSTLSLSGNGSREWAERGGKVTTTGWKPSCSHHAASWPEPCTVLDHFLGSGTTALVARRLGRRCIGIELSPEYAELAARRTHQLSLGV